MPLRGRGVPQIGISDPLEHTRTASPRLAEVPAKQAQIGWAETIGGRSRLVPVRVEQGLGTDFVQPRELAAVKGELCRGQIVGHLVLCTGPDGHRGYCGLADDVGHRRLGR